MATTRHTSLFGVPRSGNGSGEHRKPPLPGGSEGLACRRTRLRRWACGRGWRRCPCGSGACGRACSCGAPNGVVSDSWKAVIPHHCGILSTWGVTWCSRWDELARRPSSCVGTAGTVHQHGGLAEEANQRKSTQVDASGSNAHAVFTIPKV